MENPKSKPINNQKLTSFADSKAMFLYVEEYIDKVYKLQVEDDWRNVIRASQSELTEDFFLREYLWCVYVSGFSARRVAAMLLKLLDAHGITGEFNLDNVYKVNKNTQKAKAIQDTRKLIKELGWSNFKNVYLKDRKPENIRKLPMMGPATGNHLARNLGNINIAKPDVHLIRIADKYGFESVEIMCKSISGEPIGLTDLKLWYAAIDNGT